MTFNVNDFRSSFKNDPAVLNKFRVTVLGPVRLIGAADSRIAGMGRELQLRARSAELPNKIIATYDQKDHGPTSSIAYDATYPEVNVEFLLTENFNEKNFFTLWSEIIVDNENDDNSGVTDGSGGTNYVEYYENYTGTVKIDVFSSNGAAIHTTILEDAFPLAIQTIPMSWDATDVAVLSVQFKYKKIQTIIYDVDPSLPAKLGSLRNSPDLPLSGLEILNGTIDQVTDAIDSVLRKKQSLKNIVTTTRNRIETGKAQIDNIRDKIRKIF